MKHFVIFSLLVCLGCATTEDTVQGKPPKDDALAAHRGQQLASPEPGEAARPVYPDPRLSLATWPFVEQNSTFELTWDRGTRAVPLHAEPDPNSEILGEATWEKGERILWVASVVSVYQPRVVRAKQAWYSEGPVHTEGYMTEQRYVQMDVKKGQRVEVWAYGGDGLCYMAHKKDIFTAPCPPREQFSGLGVGEVPAQWFLPESKVWWVQITSNNLSAWFPVDDGILVDIVQN